MKRKAIMKALEGHENAQAILEVLDSPVEPEEMNERKNAYVVGQQGSGSGMDWLDTDSGGNPNETVHTLPQWQYGWNPEKHAEHQARQCDARARHGLQFLERPHRKGRFKRFGPAVRAKVREQYAAQTQAEADGEDWQP